MPVAQIHDGRCDHHRHRDPIGAQRNSERRRPATDDVNQWLAASPQDGENGRRNTKAGRQKNQGDAFDITSAKNQRQQNACDWQYDRQNEQKSVRRSHIEIPLHSASGLSLLCVDCRVRRSPAWRGRLPRKAAEQRDGHCGGREGNDNAGDDQRLRHRIAAKSRCRAPARDNAEQKEHPGPRRLNARILRSGCGFVTRPNNPNPTRPPTKPEQCCGIHCCCIRSAAPAAKSPSVTRLKSSVRLR